MSSPPSAPLTLLRQDEPAADKRRFSTALPRELLDRVRGRVRVLSALLFFAFAFDPGLFLAIWAVNAATGGHYPDRFFETVIFQWISAVGALASATLWWAAGRESVSPSRLLKAGLVYEAAICFMIALISSWQQYMATGHVPGLTWVPTVIVLFPLVLPGPPATMLIAAIVAGAMSPFALLLLAGTGQIVASGDEYFQTTFASGVGVTFAYFGARVVYGLGREVMAARELGSYQLERRLGRGGMGEVWRARHRMLARPAAIKLIRAPDGHANSGVSELLRRRFEREAQVIASLRSPHTVTLFDFGIAEGGAFYYAMELLDGIDADKFVRQFGAISPARAAHVLRQICHSLSEADARGLVHRDVKPANIFLCRYGEEVDFVKVLDFGLVTAFGADQDADTALTRTHVVQGTPAFMAPEQALGRHDIDGRVDVYATGCVGYWLLTGQHVFTADSSMALLMHHVHTTPDLPSTRTDRSIPADLESLIMACLAKDRDERPGSAGELSRRLADLQFPDGWGPDQARAWWREHLPVAQG